MCILAVYWGCSDVVFHLCTGGVVNVYSSCVLGCSDGVFHLCTGGVVNVYFSCVLGV